MTSHQPPPTGPMPGRGPRLLDLAGFVAGFGLASLLARTVWPRSIELAGPPAVALALELGWLGLAMSGPIVLGLDPRRARGRARPRPAPERPGRRIGTVAVVDRGQSAPSRAPAGRAEYTRAELAWLGIGGYWIAVTILVVPARATDAPWTLAGLVPILAALGMMMLIPRRHAPGPDAPRPGWTHRVAVALLWTWPIAWALLVLLTRTF